MHSGERPGAGGGGRRTAPRPSPAASATARGQGVDGSQSAAGPFAFGPGYSPWKDPTVVVLLVISLVAAVLFFGGATFGPALAGDDDGDGVFPVIDILTGDGGGDGPALSLDANRTELTVGDAVAFSVTHGNGSPVTDATVAVVGGSHDVGADGRVVVDVDRPGVQRASASAPGANDTTIESGRVDLAVARRSVDLAVRANRSTATTGEPIALTLVRDDPGTPLRGTITAAVVPPGVSVVSPGAWSTLERTGGARLVVTPERSGRLLVRATRADQNGETYRPATSVIGIERRELPLAVALDRDTATVGESISATVRRSDTGEPVDATLAIDGRTVRTGADGTAEIAVETAGKRTVEATAAPAPAIRFTPGSADVTVQHRRVALAVQVDRPAITDRGPVSATVTRADTDEPVDATVEIAGETYETGPDGTVRTTVAAVGEHAVVATAPNTSTETFAPAEATLTVADATIGLGALDAPEAASPAATVTVAANATNGGPDDGADTFELVLDGSVVDRAVVEIPAGGERRVELSGAVPAEPGQYEVAIRGSDDVVSGTVRVEE